MSRRFPWLKLPKKTDPEIPVETPIWLGNHSNGEYYHQQTPNEARMRAEILRRADEQSRYLGMERREFLASTMGMATTLAVINQQRRRRQPHAAAQAAAGRRRADRGSVRDPEAGHLRSVELPRWR
jgi:hypothetical protein